jgi:hypothetical protein
LPESRMPSKAYALAAALAAANGQAAKLPPQPPAAAAATGLCQALWRLDLPALRSICLPGSTSCMSSWALGRV